MARLGGDEFALLVTGARDARALAKHVVDALAAPFEVAGRQLPIASPCGVADAATCDGQADLMMKGSDLAMLRAKVEGRGLVVFEPHLPEERRGRSAIEGGPRAATRSGQMEVCYQPLLETRDEGLSCFEALVRWIHPERGVISPAAFVPVAEEAGLISEIGVWVLKRACREAVTWPAPIRVAVNLSPVQFAHDDLLGDIEPALTQSGPSPERREITEAGLPDAGEANVSILERLRSLGVRVSIDDFGTGGSSLSHLRSFVFDELEIVRRFVERLHDSLKSAAIIAAIVQLGVGMGIDTTAEGIETETQVAAVSKRGCSEVQGCLVGRPLQAGAARELIRKILGI